MTIRSHSAFAQMGSQAAIYDQDLVDGGSRSGADTTNAPTLANSSRRRGSVARSCRYGRRRDKGGKWGHDRSAASRSRETCNRGPASRGA